MFATGPKARSRLATADAGYVRRIHGKINGSCLKLGPKPRHNGSIPVMLTAAFIILGFAVLLGTALAILHQRTPTGAAAPWPVGALHGLLGLGGLVCLVLALRGPPRGLDRGTGSFGMIAATLIALAALAGGAILITHLRNRRGGGTLIGIHATLAVSGFVMLAAYLFA